DRRADTAATHQNAALGFAIPHRQTYSFGKIRIIHRIRVPSAKVKHLMLQLQQTRLDTFLEVKSCVVGSEGDLHCDSFLSGVRTSVRSARSAEYLRERAKLSSGLVEIRGPEPPLPVSFECPRDVHARPMVEAEDIL